MNAPENPGRIVLVIRRRTACPSVPVIGRSQQEVIGRSQQEVIGRSQQEVIGRSQQEGWARQSIKSLWKTRPPGAGV
jgi:hypothetical protein